MFLSKLSINRPVMATMLVLVFIVFGLLAYFSLPLNLMPDVEFPYVTVQTIYPGAGPQEIESQISRPIEDAVSTISLVDQITSYSMGNVSYVIIAFDFNKDADTASREVKDNVDAILNQLPSDADRPIIGTFDPAAMPIVNLVVSGNASPIDLYNYVDTQLQDRFSQIEGIARVNISGGQSREIQVNLESNIVEQFSISLPQLSQIIAAHNMDMPGGQFQQGGQEFSVRLQGEIRDLETLRNLDIPTAYGTRKLHQIAEIKDTGSEIRERSIYVDSLTGSRQEDVISIGLIRNPEGNVVEIAQQVRSSLDSIRQGMPPGYDINIVRDNSIFIEDTFKDTVNNILLGILFTGIILFFFLGDLRSTFIVAIAMPTSIISSLLFLQLFDFSLNMMTLMGFSVSVGILVTNSVVVLENIFRHKSMGNSRKVAADIGTSEITVAVIASTFTNIVVFLPIAAMSSMVGQFFKEFALAVTFATIFSLLMSFTLTPMLASLILPKESRKGKFGASIDKMINNWEKFYAKLLSFIIKRKTNALGLLSITVILFILSFFIAAQIGFEFMPFLDEGNITIEVELPEGYDISETSKIIEEIDQIIASHNEVDQIVTDIGSTGTLNVGVNLARIRVSLVSADQRDLNTRQVANNITRALASTPNADIRVTATSSAGGGGGSSDISFDIRGADQEVLNELTQKALEELASTPGMINLDSSIRPGSPQITFTPKMGKLSAVGLTIFDLAMVLRSSIEGTVATRFREDGNEYDIRVRLNRSSVDTPQKIGDIPVITQFGTFKFSQLADLSFTEGSRFIMRKDKNLAVEITGDVAIGYTLGEVSSNISQTLNEIEFPIGYSFRWGGETEMMQETVLDMLQTFIIAVLLTYMLLAAILESFLQPLFILVTLPFALIGVFVAMFLSGLSMNIVSMMSIIMLVGIVVNNAILLLDYTNQLVRIEGKTVKEALITACPTKLRPIIMASGAIILGMLPMALGLGAAGREFRQPMGIVSIGGLVVSTLLALFVIPSLYYLIHRDKPTQ